MIDNLQSHPSSMLYEDGDPEGGLTSFTKEDEKALTLALVTAIGFVGLMYVITWPIVQVDKILERIKKKR